MPVCIAVHTGVAFGVLVSLAPPHNTGAAAGLADGGLPPGPATDYTAGAHRRRGGIQTLVVVNTAARRPWWSADADSTGLCCCRCCTSCRRRHQMTWRPCCGQGRCPMLQLGCRRCCRRPASGCSTSTSHTTSSWRTYFLTRSMPSGPECSFVWYNTYLYIRILKLTTLLLAMRKKYAEFVTP